MILKKTHIVLIILFGVISNVFSVCTADFSFIQSEQDYLIFVNESSSHDGGTIHYYWDFGDGDVSYETNPEHLFENPGIYKVSLSLITSELCHDEIIKTVYIGVESPSELCDIEIILETSNANYPGYDNGSARITNFSEFDDNFEAIWSNGQEGAEIENLIPGVYCVTLTNNDYCYASSCVSIGYNNNCMASFLIDSTTFSHPKGTYRFINNSHGEQDYFLWDFGDGTTHMGYNPLHIYNDEGTYNVCLEIHTLYGCSDIFCKEVTINNSYPIITNLHGYVNAGQTALPSGIAVLYKVIDTVYTAIEYTQIEDGEYIFNNLSRENLYLTHLIPHFDIDEVFFPKYIATYSGNSIHWSENEYINLYADTICNSSLVANDEIYYGYGKISGLVKYYDSYEEDIFGQNWIDNTAPFQEGFACNITVLLKDKNHNILDFALSDKDGKYIFENLKCGEYYISVEKAGLNSDELHVILDDENLINTNNNFSIQAQNISNIKTNFSEKDFIISPNPFSENINIKDLPKDTYLIEIFNTSGKLITKIKPQNNYPNQINLSQIKSGIYTIKITTKNGVLTQKIIKL